MKIGSAAGIGAIMGASLIATGALAQTAKPGVAQRPITLAQALAERERPRAVAVAVPAPVVRIAQVAPSISTAPVVPPSAARASPVAPTLVASIVAPIVAVQAMQVPGPAAGVSLLPPNTPVMLTLNSEINSKTIRRGDDFDLSVASDVMVGGFIVIPRGTRARGQVTYRTGKGVFGKSAKIEVAMQSILLSGRVIPLSGSFREEGRGNTGATIGTALAAGLLPAMFVTGHSAVIPAGREFRAYTKDAVPVQSGGTN